MKEAFGNMCPKLCNELRLSKCHGWLSFGKRVAVLECDGCLKQGEVTKVAMKKYQNLPPGIELEYSKALNSTEQRLFIKRFVSTFSKSFFGVHLPEDLDIVSFLLGDEVNKQLEYVNSKRASETVNRLALKHGMGEEFLSLKVLGSNTFLPKLYGVCGEEYFVEYTPSLVTLNHVFDSLPDVRSMYEQFPSWKERVDVAIKLLDFVLKIEDDLPKPFHFCDAKGSNFGINSKGDLTLTDSDGIRTSNIIQDIPCGTDIDCHFVHCPGMCNKTTQRCSPYMLTTNLQGICQRIFLTKYEKLGLLRDPPTSIRGVLSEHLKECIHPREKTFKLPDNNKSDRKMLIALKSLLERSIGGQ